MPSKTDAGSSGGGGGVALVTGATGVVGRYLVMHLAALRNWRVFAVTRKAALAFEEHPEGLGGAVTPVQVTDLLDSEGVAAALTGCAADITHFFHCAYVTSNSSQHEDDCNNLKMFNNVLSTLEGTQSKPAAASSDEQAPASAAATAAAGGARGQLQHVYVQAGSKWYGQHWGTKYKTPARETDPRYMTPNFYYSLVDSVASRVAEGAPWSWSALLPNPVIGYSPASFMNLMNAIAGYAALCKELKLPFRFPGTDAAYNALTECCDARLLAKAIVFTSTTPGCANQIYNVSNGDVFRWSEVWPMLAKHFGLEAPPPQAISLQTTMSGPDKQQAWQALLVKHNIQQHPSAAAYDKLIQWRFADFVFGFQCDFFQSVTKLRQAGFNGMAIDTPTMWIDWMCEVKKLGVLPL